MKLVGAPPGMQPWIRETDLSLRSLNSTLARLEAAIARMEMLQQRSLVAASMTDELMAPTGMSPPDPFTDWDLAATGQGPDVVVTALTGRIIVTLSAYMTATWDVPASPAQAHGAMTFSVDDVLVGGSLDTAARNGAVRSFSYVPGQPTTEDDTVTAVVDLRVPPGTYTLRSEYLYQNFTAGIQVAWSYRTIVAEPR